MLARKAEEEIQKAICYELQNIVSEYGPNYHSAHEGYAILKEEMEEASDALEDLSDKLELIWENCKLNWSSDTEIYQAQQAAISLAGEAVQCAAVCAKFLDSIKRK